MPKPNTLPSSSRAPSEQEGKDFVAAAQAGDAAAVDAFLQEFGDAYVDVRSGYDTTALVDAAGGGHLAIMQALIDHGADVNANDWANHTTPLMAAAMHGCEDCIRLLLNHNADMEATSQIQATALIQNASMGRDRMVAFLLDMGANIHAGAERGFTALQAAAYYDKPSTVELLLARGAAGDINLLDGMKMTPLMWAAYRGAGPAAQLLLEYGADASIKSGEGKTAADYAREQGHPETAGIITGEGAARQKREAELEKLQKDKQQTETGLREAALQKLKDRAPKNPLHLQKHPKP